MFNKILASIIMGIIVAILSSIVGGLAAGGGEDGGVVALWSALVGFLLIGVLALTAATGRYAWGRGMLLCGILSFAMPLASILFTIVFSVGHFKTVPTDTASQVGASLGAGLAGTAMTVFTGVIGFFLGLIFVVTSYFLLRAPRVYATNFVPAPGYAPQSYPPPSYATQNYAAPSYPPHGHPPSAGPQPPH
jgi:hypothetical protein